MCLPPLFVDLRQVLGGRPVCFAESRAVPKTQLAQGAKRPLWERAARREAASLLLSRRPARVEAAASCGPAACQPCRRHVKPVGAQCTPTDWLRTRRKVRSGPRCPTAEAINPDRQTSAQRKERSTPNRRTSAQRKKRSTPTVRRVSGGRSRSTPTAEQCPAGEGLITPTAGRGPRDEGLITPSIRSVLLAKGLSLRGGSISSWAAFSV